MRRLRTNLKVTGTALLAAAGVNVVVLLCMCVLLTSYRPLRYGVNIHPADTHYVIEAYDRTGSHIIAVSPGETPRFFLESQEIHGGFDGVEKVLASWDCPNPSRITVIVACDEAVSIGTIQKLTDLILLHGFNCAFFGRPANDE